MWKPLALRQHFKGTTSSCTKALQCCNCSVKTVVQFYADNIFPSVEVRLANESITLFYLSPYSTGNCSLKLFLLFFLLTKFEAINLRWKTQNQLKYIEHFLPYITLSGQVTYWSVSFSTCCIPLYSPHQPGSVLSGPTSLLFLHLCLHFCRSSLQTPAQGSQPLLAARSLSKFRFNDKRSFLNQYLTQYYA